MKLYATPTGKRYHRTAHCEGLNSWATAHGYDAMPPTITALRAMRRGLEPCRTCKPPPLLTVVQPDEEAS